MAHGWAKTGMIFPGLHMDPPPEKTRRFVKRKIHQKLQQKLDCNQMIHTNWFFNWVKMPCHPSSAWCRLAKKKTIFQSQLWYRRVEKHWNTMNHLKMVWRYSKKTSYIYIYIYHKHLGSSWYILGLSWFLISSPVWIVLWCFFVEKCWKHETVRTKCQSCQSPWQLRFEQFRFDLVASWNWHSFFETSGRQYETFLFILFFAPLSGRELSKPNDLND